MVERLRASLLRREAPCTAYTPTCPVPFPTRACDHTWILADLFTTKRDKIVEPPSGAKVNNDIAAMLGLCILEASTLGITSQSIYEH